MKKIQLKCEHCGKVFDSSRQAKVLFGLSDRGISCKECRYEYSKLQKRRRWLIKKGEEELDTFKAIYEKRTGRILKQS
ncbi:MAG: hypothetical protein DRI86_07405 [Bacteroidetes bacterium]|nr:MAG: hypothetical protein DRI86_07405 [Bacteroidota bacterium]